MFEIYFECLKFILNVPKFVLYVLKFDLIVQNYVWMSEICFECPNLVLNCNVVINLIKVCTFPTSLQNNFNWAWTNGKMRQKASQGETCKIMSMRGMKENIKQNFRLFGLKRNRGQTWFLFSWVILVALRKLFVEEWRST